MKIIRVVDFKLERAGEIAVVIKRIMRYIGSRLWQEIVIKLRACCMKTASVSSYQLLRRSLSASVIPEIKDLEACESGFGPDGGLVTPVSDISVPQSGELAASDLNADDTVVLKITLLGDCETGKTSFMLKYVSSQRNDKYAQTMGISSMDKILRVRGAKIAFSIWDLGGHQKFMNLVPMACQDAAAILIMFDLTSRPTLNSVMEWYQQARQCNQIAIPVLVGTKFDHFIHLPLDIQLTIVKQARLYARAMGAILFFSSVTHNINVHKIFKVITAKLFDLPCNIARNLTVGEPIVDY